MILSKIFKNLPEDMVFRSHIDGEKNKASVWAEKLSNETDAGYAIHDSKRNYGAEVVKVIFYPGTGMCFSEDR